MKIKMCVPYFIVKQIETVAIAFFVIFFKYLVYNIILFTMSKRGDGHSIRCIIVYTLEFKATKSA